MAGIRKWLFGVLGWSFGGPIGALFGFIMGAYFDYAAKVGKQYRSSDNRRSTTIGDFQLSLLALLAAIMKADRRNLKVELNYIKDILRNTYGEQQALEMMPILRELLLKEIPVRDICAQIRYNMDHASRLELVSILFKLSMVDNQFHAKEEILLKQIATWLGLSEKDYNSINSVYKKDEDWAYKVLEISQNATDEEVRKAYRRMAMKYHPDRVSHLGQDVAKSAEEKFKAVNNAWEQIKTERNIN